MTNITIKCETSYDPKYADIHRLTVSDGKQAAVISISDNEGLIGVARQLYKFAEHLEQMSKRCHKP